MTKRHINIDKSELTEEEREDWREEEEHRRYMHRTEGHRNPEVWENKNEYEDWDD
jgi:hypothetical protein